jgi:uncharacterized protein HemY
VVETKREERGIESREDLERGERERERRARLQLEKGTRRLQEERWSRASGRSN